VSLTIENLCDKERRSLKRGRKQKKKKMNKNKKKPRVAFWREFNKKNLF
jgi:hypothetical protein